MGDYFECQLKIHIEAETVVTTVWLRLLPQAKFIIAHIKTSFFQIHLYVTVIVEVLLVDSNMEGF